MPAMNLTPLQMWQRFHNLSVYHAVEGEEPDSFDFRLYSGIKMNRYLIAKWKLSDAVDAGKREKYDNFIKKHIKHFRKLHRWSRKNQPYDKSTKLRIMDCFQGKGRPEDYEMALELAIDAAPRARSPRGSRGRF